MANIVYIATSLDGYIADKNGGLEWLETVPNPDKLDLGWAEFMARIDGLIMGRNTFEAVLGFDCPWPYEKPVYVMSTTLTEIPDKAQGKAELVAGSLQAIIAGLHEKGKQNLYIDGGKTIQSFLKEDLIDELIVTQIPVLLGGGARLFGDLDQLQNFELVKSDVLLGQLVQNHYRRKS